LGVLKFQKKTRPVLRAFLILTISSLKNIP
jgi:hypothetical protein